MMECVFITLSTSPQAIFVKEHQMLESMFDTLSSKLNNLDKMYTMFVLFKSILSLNKEKYTLIKRKVDKVEG